MLSRSRSSKLTDSRCPPRSMNQVRAVRVTPALLGCVVAPRIRIRRGSVLDDRQNVGGGAVEEVHGDEVRRQDRLCLAMQELRSVGPARRGGGIAPLVRISHTVQAARWMPRNVEFSMDPSVTPASVPRASRRTKPRMLRRADRGRVLRPAGPAAVHDVTVPAQHRLRRDEYPQPGSPWPWDDVQQEGDQCPVRPAGLGTPGPGAAGPCAGDAGAGSPRISTTRHAESNAAAIPAW